MEADNFEYGLGSLLTDLDSDGDLDLFVANDTNPNRLYENVTWPGGPDSDPQGLGFRFVETGQYTAVSDENSGMGVASADYDQDGQNDLMITNLGQQLHSVYLNQSVWSSAQRLNIVMTPQATKALHRALGANIERYEKSFGEISLHGQEPSQQMGFKPEE